MKARFPIGLQFKYHFKKYNNEYVILDVLTTTNSHGIIVDIRYLVSHEFMGQQLTEVVGDLTIARSLGNDGIMPFLKNNCE